MASGQQTEKSVPQSCFPQREAPLATQCLTQQFCVNNTVRPHGVANATFRCTWRITPRSWVGERQSAWLTVDRTRRGHGEELRATYRD